jgi:hypothetical protein
MKTMMFQNVDINCIPRVIPMIEHNYSTYLLSGTMEWNSYFVNLDFNKQRSSQKLISNISWNKEILFPFGHLIDLSGTLSFIGLKVSEKTRSEYDSLFCTIPQLNFMWKWPLLLSSKVTDTIFIPICGVIMAGNKKYNDAFEDQFCEITDMNFLHGNKSISSYNIDSGNRIYYGLKLSGYRNGKNVYHFTAARSTELVSVSDKLETSGLKHRNSNIVMALDVFLSNRWTSVTNASYSVQSKHWTKLETGLNFIGEEICFDIMVFKGKQCLFNPFITKLTSLTEAQKIQKYRGITINTSICATKTIKLNTGLIMGNDQDTSMAADISNNNNLRPIKYNVGLEYRNECAMVNCTVERRNYKSGDLKPETVFQFVIHLKNLGV